MTDKEWAKVQALPADIRALISTELRHICGEVMRVGSSKPLYDFVYRLGPDLYPRGMKQLVDEGRKTTNPLAEASRPLEDAPSVLKAIIEGRPSKRQ